MEIDLRPPFGGCLTVFVIVVTLGTFPLLRRMRERHFIARMDDDGFETRGGKRVAWSEVDHIQHVVFEQNGARLSDEYTIGTSKWGRSSLPVWRATNGIEALDYLVQRAPQAAWVKE